MGDPIEVGALRATLLRSFSVPNTAFSVFPSAPPAPAAALVSAAKTNLGHALAASGLLGLARCSVAFPLSLAPASVHLRERNRYFGAGGAADDPVTQFPTETAPPAAAARAGSFFFG